MTISIDNWDYNNSQQQAYIQALNKLCIALNRKRRKTSDEDDKSEDAIHVIGCGIYDVTDAHKQDLKDLIRTATKRTGYKATWHTTTDEEEPPKEEEVWPHDVRTPERKAADIRKLPSHYWEQEYTAGPYGYGDHYDRVNNWYWQQWLQKGGKHPWTKWDTIKDPRERKKAQDAEADARLKRVQQLIRR